MLTASYTVRFKKDLKLMDKRGINMRKIFIVMTDLQNEVPLQSKHRVHQLTGNYKGFMECHVEPDWLLIYKIDLQTEEILFVRTGTHSDLLE
jgi:addiction module toxin, RelE/StbE family